MPPSGRSAAVATRKNRKRRRKRFGNARKPTTPPSAKWRRKDQGEEDDAKNSRVKGVKSYRTDYDDSSTLLGGERSKCHMDVKVDGAAAAMSIWIGMGWK